MINRIIAHYKITSKLGQGGMGEVYQATDTTLDHEVAIRILAESSVANDPCRLLWLRIETGIHPKKNGELYED